MKINSFRKATPIVCPNTTSLGTLQIQKFLNRCEHEGKFNLPTTHCYDPNDPPNSLKHFDVMSIVWRSGRERGRDSHYVCKPRTTTRVDAGENESRLH